MFVIPRLRVASGAWGARSDFHAVGLFYAPKVVRKGKIHQLAGGLGYNDREKAGYEFLAAVFP